MQFLPHSHRLLYRIMRITVCQLLLALLCSGLTLARNVHAQELLTRRVTLQVKEQSVKTILTRLSKLTHVRFTYSSALIRAERKVTLNASNQPLGEVLDELLKPLKIEYRVETDEVILNRVPVGTLPHTNSDQAGSTPEAADITVSGTVTDERGEALPGVSIVVKGTSRGITSDQKGNFQLNIPTRNNRDAELVLVFSFVGYESQEITIGNQTVLKVSLKNDIKALNEVVVVGYGTVKKTDLTGSVSSISSKDIESVPIATTEQILQGRAAGVVVTQNSSEPGSGASIRIRGTNSIGAGNEPLFVIDGFAGADNLTSINPNDIDNIEILKDASATAIYGARGANGVVIVTTKRGKAGAPRIDFEMYTGGQEIRKKIGLMDAFQYATYRNEILYNDSVYRQSTAPVMYFASPNRLEYLKTNSTDWQDALYRRSGLSNYQLSVSGGDDKTRYLISGSFYNENGVVINSGFKRGSLRVNFDKTVNPRLKYGLTLLGTRTYNNRTQSVQPGSIVGGVVLNTFRINPATPVYNPDGTYNLYNVGADNGDIDLIGNAVAYAEKVKDDTYITRINANWFGEYEVLKNLKFRVNLGGDLFTSAREAYIPSDIYEGTRDNGTATRAISNRYSWINENYLTYFLPFSQSTDLTLLAGASWQLFNQRGTTAIGRNFFTNTFEDNNLSAATGQETSSSQSQNQIQSYFVRANFKLNTKYLFTLTGRRDGSSRFGANNRYGYFPSGAFAWRVSEEPWVKNLGLFDDLKVRTSYGITGNQEIPNYNSTEAYSTRTATYGATRQIGALQSRFNQPDLRWEKTASFDVGLDISVLKNRVGLVMDYYWKKTSDQLLNIETQRATGFSSVLINAGSIENRGFEFALNTVNVDTRKVKWTTNANIAFTRNKVLDLNGEKIRYVGAVNVAGIGNGGSGVLIPGESIGSFYGLTFLGLWQTREEIAASSLTANEKTRFRPGDPIFKDVNGDGKIDLNDRTIIGQALPKFNYGMTNTVSYKGFSVSVFINGVYGNSLLNLNRIDLETQDNSNKSLRMLERWNGPGTSNTVPRAGSGGVRRQVSSDLLEDGSYLRLKNLTLAYQVSAASGFMRRLRLRNLKVYTTATNLLTFTSYTGYDPEVSTFAAQNSLALGIDYGSYPTIKSVIVGLKLGL
ncbi:SusC/RagA family TonB-linked outer membrane protein [Fibrisoma montanum]|uniref:SusC/RagA family TonB-linked outer membrane protein n=2 Tax=Fibrisoma montanum TaxID=2305895 RepID=A0A418LZ60_9BACT|nr:SusC/RagA family TonB-linked outer membrane protein [Fibrisoma montanum]